MPWHLIIIGSYLAVILVLLVCVIAMLTLPE